jgi:hypothetical protein
VGDSVTVDEVILRTVGLSVYVEVTVVEVIGDRVPVVWESEIGELPSPEHARPRKLTEIASRNNKDHFVCSSDHPP